MKQSTSILLHAIHRAPKAAIRWAERLKLGRTALGAGLVWALMASASATTYYVDFASGSDTRAGTSKETAWKRAPGDSNAAGVALATVLRPGDVVHFKGGVVYSGGVALKTSGLAGQEIILDGNHSGTWGVGRAVIDRNYDTKSCLSILANMSHLKIRGFELRNSGGYADNNPILLTKEPLITAPPSGTGIGVAGGHKNLHFQNLFIHRIGQWRNQLPFSGTNSITGNGIWLQDCDGVVVENCELTKMRTPISITAASSIKNVVVNKCSIHDYVVWGIDIAPRQAGATLENISVLNTTIRDYHQFDQGNWLGDGEKPHTDGIFIRTADMVSVWKNINVAGCFFYADNPGASWGGTASIYVSQGPSVNIYNNVFYKDKHTRTIGIEHWNPAGMQPQVVKIYNNTFMEGPTHISMADEQDPAKRSIYIQNNIFQLNGQANYVMMNYQSGVKPKIMDNNLYWSGEFGVDQKLVAYFNGWRTFAQFKELGYEKNGRFINPGFRVASAPSATGLDLRPLSSTPVRFGANLSSLFSKDRGGLPRPATGVWDVGAHVWSDGATAILPLTKPLGYGSFLNWGTN